MSVLPTIRVVMVGQKPFPPYEQVSWIVWNAPDNTGAHSGYGANYLINVGVDPNGLSVSGMLVNPITLAAGGDLTGSYPNPTVSGIQGNAISATVPTTGQFLTWSGTSWSPSSSFPSGTFTNLTVTDTLTADTIKTGTLIALSDSSNLGIGSVSGTVTVTSGADIQVIAGTKAVVAAPEVEMQTTNLGRIDLNFNGQDRHSFTYSSGSTQAVYSLSPTGKIASPTLTLESVDINLTTENNVNVIGGLLVDSTYGSSVYINSPNGIDLKGPIGLLGLEGQFTMSVVDNSTTTGDALFLSAGSSIAASSTGGGLSLKAGTGTTYSGNIGLNMTAPAASNSNGQLCLYIGNTTTAPSSNPSGGFALYSSSGVAKIRSGANTVTLGDKPTVTGSRASGDALVNLLTVLATAGLITNNTSA